MSSSQSAQKEILRAAAHWYSVLCGEDVTEQQKREHAEWVEADPSHQLAWQQVEKLRQQLQSVPGASAFHTLQIKQQQGQKRRAVLRSFAFLAGGASLGSLAWRQTPVNGLIKDWTAGHRTVTGERRELALDDGTQLILNTDTALDLLETDTSRLVRLYDGEIFVRTGSGVSGNEPGRGAKPLQVHTEQGMVIPLGTVFTVRKHPVSTSVTVIEDRVELIPVSAAGQSEFVDAGEQAEMSSGGVAISPASPQMDSWTRGLLVAVDWPLSRLVAELSRYRAGVLRCDPAVAALRISGAYPLDDTERALQAISNALPVRVSRITDYWVTVTALL
ncbi:FecR domain-containing protein [Marinobacterium lutimaris]|uniref:FecR family protein n=1 Tax=Marinobacterium lutimaris TaxID=568106 RepID=A0A1H5XBK7_9GAMM|nr:FecR domain-containing protein [Marinobacterium lutimaris]SEG09109.1 FecR family protein [Marinobacterium lutimaris]